MAIEYQFESAEDLDEKQVTELLSVLNFEYKEPPFFVGTGIMYHISTYEKPFDPANPHETRTLINEYFGFIPKFLVYMRILDDFDAGVLNVLKIANVLLTKTTADAVLSNYEYVYLKRIGGKLTLNNEDPLNWPPEHKKLLELPFEENVLNPIS